MKQKPVLIVSVKGDANLGDYLLGDCLIKLLKSNIGPRRYVLVDLRGREQKAPILRFFKKAFRKICRLFKKSIVNDYALELESFFRPKIRNSAAVIFAGGGIIEYNHYSSDFYIKTICSIAEKNNIPVIFNAVGLLDRYNPSNLKAVSLSKTLLSDNVKFIGVRENPNWMEGYLDGVKKVQFVCDPACWCSQIYGFDRDETSNIIGIGIIRPTIFADYGLDVSENEISRIYFEVINYLKSKNYQYVFFSNGSPEDKLLIDTLYKLYPELENEQSCKLLVPKDASDLIKIISKFKVVFASRMHASIISYSLGIPSISLCWANKIEAFYKNINKPDCCVWPSDDNATAKIIKTLSQLLNEKCLFEGRYIFLNSAVLAIEEYKKFIL